MENEVTIEVYHFDENGFIEKTTQEKINLSIEEDKKFGTIIIKKGRQHLLKYLKEDRLNLVDKKIPDILVRLGEIYRNSNEKSKQDKMSDFIEAYKSSAAKQIENNDIIEAEALSMWAAFVGPKEKIIKSMTDDFLLKKKVEQNKQMIKQIGRAGRPRPLKGADTSLANINIATATATIDKNFGTNQQQSPGFNG